MLLAEISLLTILLCPSKQKNNVRITSIPSLPLVTKHRDFKFPICCEDLYSVIEITYIWNAEVLVGRYGEFSMTKTIFYQILYCRLVLLLS